MKKNFKLCGDKSCMDSDSEEGHNCFTWAREVLNNLVGSDIHISSTWRDNIAAVPSMNIGGPPNPMINKVCSIVTKWSGIIALTSFVVTRLINNHIITLGLEQMARLRRASRDVNIQWWLTGETAGNYVFGMSGGGFALSRGFPFLYPLLNNREENRFYIEINPLSVQGNEYKIDWQEINEPLKPQSYALIFSNLPNREDGYGEEIIDQDFFNDFDDDLEIETYSNFSAARQPIEPEKEVDIKICSLKMRR